VSREIAGWRDSLANLGKRTSKADCPDYVVKADTLVPPGQSIILSPGVWVRVEPGVAFGTAGGQLLARGTADARVIIAGTSAGRGTWGGLQLRDSADTQLAFVTIEGGGAGGTGNVVTSGMGSVAMEDVILRDSAGFGLVLGADTGLAGLSNNTFTGNTLGAARVHIGQARDFTANNRYAGNDRDVVEIYGNNLNVESTWNAIDVPYLLGEPGSAQVSFMRDALIEPGVRMSFRENVGLLVRLGATFTARGAVRFAGESDVPGAWRGIAASEGAQVELEGVTIENGGGGEPWSAAQGMSGRANLTVLADTNGTRVTVTGATLTGSLANAIWIEQSPGVNAACSGMTASQPIVPECPYSR
jgi:hypothetical protein